VSASQFDPTDDPEDAKALLGFDGLTRLFPLPNVVLFPGVLLPLHIFEPRYRQMLSDALDSDQLITLVLLKAGPDELAEDPPPLSDVGCIGRIVYHNRLPDGRSNLILKGLRRTRIDSELPQDRMYRTARVTILHDVHGGETGKPTRRDVQRILRNMTEILNGVGRGSEADKLSVASELPPGRLCDLACHCLGFDVQAKQSMLEELDVGRRINSLVAWMDALLQTLQRRSGPIDHVPPFSVN